MADPEHLFPLSLFKTFFFFGGGGGGGSGKLYGRRPPTSSNETLRRFGICIAKSATVLTFLLEV